MNVSVVVEVGLWLLMGAPPGEDASVFLYDTGTCGQTCLYAIARQKGVDVGWDRAKELVGPAKEGIHSLTDLADAGGRLGMFPVGAHVDRSRLIELPSPAIVHFKWLGDDKKVRLHYAVALGWNREGVYVLDPPFPARLYSWQRFETAWTGNVLLFADTAEEAEQMRRALSPPWQFHVLRLLLAVNTLLLGGSILVLIRHRVMTLLGYVGGVFWEASFWCARAVVGGCKVNVARAWRRGTVWAFLAGLGVVLVALSAFFASGWAAALFPREPRLETPEGVVELGEFAPGERNAAVVLRNVGDAPLVIERIASSCSCAVAEGPDRIESGGSSELRLSLGVRPGGKYADLVVFSNDPRGAQRITLHWNGSAKPALYPPRILATGRPLGEPYEYTVRLVYPGSHSAILPEVTRVEYDTGQVEARVGGNNPVAFRTSLSTSKHSTVGYLDLHVRVPSPAEAQVIETGCRFIVKYGKEEYTLELPIKVEFVGKLQAASAEVILSAPSLADLLGKQRHIALWVSDADGEPSILESPDGLRCRVLPKSATQYDLLVEVNAIPRSLCEGGQVVVGVGADPSRRTSITVQTFAMRIK